MFNTKIPLYGIMLLISISTGLFLIYKSLKKSKYKKDQIMALMLYMFLGIVFGAKYFTYFTNFSRYKSNFNFMQIGFSSYGAVIGVIIVFVLYSKQFKKSFMELLLIMLPPIPLMYAIGKIGCFFAGCCYGIEYNGIFNIVYKYSVSAPNNVKLFPVQLAEAIVFILIFVFIQIMKNKVSSKIIPLTFVLCGISKFLLDYLRSSHVNVILSVNQIVSIVFIIIGVFFFIKKPYKPIKKL